MTSLRYAKLGFTGNQDGMTNPQRKTVRWLVRLANASEGHHGDCVGSDRDFHVIITKEELTTVGHIPIEERKRAYCKFDVTCKPKPYLARNHDIVRESDAMIATPRGTEEELRSGTWATIRYARQLNKPLFIVWPDGSFTGYNVGETK